MVIWKWLFLLLLFSVQALAEPVIRVKPLVLHNSGTEIKLSDLCDFEGVDSTVIHQLQDVVLGDGPRLGESRAFSSQVLSQVFRRQMKQFSQRVKLSIPKKVIVENRGHKLEEGQVKKHLVSAWTELCSECRFRFQSLNMPLVSEKQKGQRWKLMPRPVLPKGPFSVQMRLFDEATHKEKIYWVNGVVEIHRKVPVLKVSKGVHESVKPDDISYEFRDTTHIRTPILTEDSLLHRRLTRTVNAGEILRSHLLKREKVLRRGELVKLVFEEDHYQVGIMGEAQEDGYLGDLVRVKNRGSNRTVVGRLVARGKVRLE